MAEGNGNYVSRAEMGNAIQAAVGPLKTEIAYIKEAADETRSDVKQLLLAHASEAGGDAVKKSFVESKRFLIMLGVAVLGCVCTLAASGLWIAFG